MTKHLAFSCLTHAFLLAKRVRYRQIRDVAAVYLPLIFNEIMYAKPSIHTRHVTHCKCEHNTPMHLERFPSTTCKHVPLNAVPCSPLCQKASMVTFWLF
jgi:hypothetical protein